MFFKFSTIGNILMLVINFKQVGGEFTLYCIFAKKCCCRN